MGELIPNKLFYKIGEVCQYTDTQPYVLRFWESEFSVLAPDKNRSGQRIYSREDIDLVLRIKSLLYDEEYTIAGARKRLEQELRGGKAAKSAKSAKGSTKTESRPTSRAPVGRESEEIRSDSVPEPGIPVVMPRSESLEIESLERRLADMEERWKRAEIALNEAGQARAEFEERCERVAAKLDAALSALAALREASAGD